MHVLSLPITLDTSELAMALQLALRGKVLQLALGQ